MSFMTVAAAASPWGPREPGGLHDAAEWLEGEIQNATDYDNDQVRRGHEAEWTDFVEQIGPGLQEMIHAYQFGVSPARALESFNITVNRIINEYIGNEDEHMSVEEMEYVLDGVIDSSSEEISNYLATLKLFWQDGIDPFETRDHLLEYIDTTRREHIEYRRHTGAEEMRWGATHHRLPRGRVPRQDHHTYTHWDPPPPRTWSDGALAAAMSDSDDDDAGRKPKKSRKRRQTGKPKKSRKTRQTGKPKKSRKGQKPRKPKKSRKGRK